MQHTRTSETCVMPVGNHRQFGSSESTRCTSIVCRGSEYRHMATQQSRSFVRALDSTVTPVVPLNNHCEYNLAVALNEAAQATFPKSRCPVYKAHVGYTVQTVFAQKHDT